MPDAQFLDALMTMAVCGALLGVLLPMAWPEHFDPMYKRADGEH